MAAITTTEAVSRVLEAVGRVDGDVQCPSDAILARIDTEYKRLRRRVASEFPSIYEAISSTITVTGSGYTVTKPSGCEFVRVLERQFGSTWTPVMAATSLNRDEMTGLCFYEQGDHLTLAPTQNAAGTYRIHYSAMPVDGYTTLDVPEGLVDIIIEKVAAWVRVRHEEDPTPHNMEAARIWSEQYMPLWNRYGSHGRSALNLTRD